MALPRGLRRSALTVRAAEKSGFSVDEALLKYKEVSYKIPPVASACTLPVVGLSLLCKLLTGTGMRIVPLQALSVRTSWVDPRMPSRPCHRPVTAATAIVRGRVREGCDRSVGIRSATVLRARCTTPDTRTAPSHAASFGVCAHARARCMGPGCVLGLDKGLLGLSGSWVHAGHGLPGALLGSVEGLAYLVRGPLCSPRPLLHRTVEPSTAGETDRLQRAPSRGQCATLTKRQPV